LLSMDPSTFAALGSRAVTADLLPLLPALTTPALRPVSRHLFSKDEQACVDRLVGTLLSLGLKYSLYVEDMGDGDDEDANAILGAAARAAAMGASAVVATLSKDPPLQFRPPVHRLWHFRGAVSLINGSGSLPRRSLPIATRQMVCHEAEMESIRRADAAKQAAAAGGPSNAAAAATQQTTQQQQQRTGHVPLDLAQRLKESGRAAKMATASAKVAAKGTWLDHLRDRQYEERTAAASAAAPNGGFAMGAARFPVLYKFHEGYTNAVKRPLLMSELL
jgi:chromosome transmission fidelity protein 18